MRKQRLSFFFVATLCSCGAMDEAATGSAAPGAVADSSYIRRAALQARLPIYTTIAGASTIAARAPRMAPAKVKVVCMCSNYMRDFATRGR